MAFVTDAFRRKIVGWNVPSRLTTESLPFEALDMASWVTTHALTGLRYHADHGSQHVSRRYPERLADLGIQSFAASVGCPYDNALAEKMDWPFRAELINAHNPSRTIDEVELTTLEWVWWFNNTRLSSEVGYRKPNEIDTA